MDKSYCYECAAMTEGYDSMGTSYMWCQFHRDYCDKATCICKGVKK